VEAGLPQNEGQNILNSKDGRFACDEQRLHQMTNKFSIWGGESNTKRKNPWSAYGIAAGTSECST
jgi:hypothetical protein